MATNWRISSFNGALLAAYFIPTWTIIAFKIMISPIHGFYEQPNVSIAIFASDYLQLAATGTIRAAWLLALGRLTVVAFFAIFVALISRPSVRQAGGCDEALGIALGIGSLISFALMVMASRAGETAALRLHGTVAAARHRRRAVGRTARKAASRARRVRPSTDPTPAQSLTPP